MPEPLDFTIRAATADDQALIRQMIRDAQLNPSHLDWPNFLLAETGGKVIGLGQMKPLKDGTKELASIATLPDYQKHGITSAIINKLLDKESGPIYLMCEKHNETFYHRFGFRRLSRAELPSELGKRYNIVRLIMPIAKLFYGDFELLIMGRGLPQ